jgi:hypothetical protein
MGLLGQVLPSGLTVKHGWITIDACRLLSMCNIA